MATTPPRCQGGEFQGGSWQCPFCANVVSFAWRCPHQSRARELGDHCFENVVGKGRWKYRATSHQVSVSGVDALGLWPWLVVLVPRNEGPLTIFLLKAISIDYTDFLSGEQSRSDFGLDRATAALLHCSFGGAAALGEPFMKSRCCQWWLFWLLRVAFFSLHRAIGP